MIITKELDLPTFRLMPDGRFPARADGYKMASDLGQSLGRGH
jgi:hypothetical protein